MPPFKAGAYISLRVKDIQSGKIAYADDMISQFIDSDDVNFITLLGDYGSGKTTYAKYLFKTLADRYLASGGISRLPIYINLRDYPGHLNMPSLITDLLVNQYECRYKGHATLVKLMKENMALLILDGFDEIASRTDYQVTLNNFRAVAKLVEDNSKILLTCRTHYFKDKGEIARVMSGTELYRLGKDYGNRLIMMQGFSEDDIEKYVGVVCAENAGENMRLIRSTYDLMGLAGRPILLDMITEVLPRLIDEGKSVNPATLYAKYAQAWLERDDWRVTLSAERRLQFTTAFAEEMYARGASKFTWKDVEIAIAKKFPNATSKEREYFSHDIRTCTFINWDTGLDQYRFVHESFMEYFVAASVYEGVVTNPDYALSTKQHTAQVIDFFLSHPQTSQLDENLYSLLPLSASTRTDTEDSPEKSSAYANTINILSTRKMEIAGRIFSKAVLANLRLTGNRWQSNEFRNLIIQDSDFYLITQANSTLSSVKLANVTSRDSKFESDILMNCSFSMCRADSCICTHRVYRDVDYSHCSVSKSTSSRTTVHGLNATAIQTESGGVYDSYLTDVEIKDARFDSAQLHRTSVSRGVISSSKISKCTFDIITIHDVKLLSSVFDHCEITNSTFRSCTFNNTQFTNNTNLTVEFRDFTFTKSCLFDVVSLSGAVFNDCIFKDAMTTLTSILNAAKSKAVKPGILPIFAGCKGITPALAMKISGSWCVIRSTAPRITETTPGI